jgi:DNA repair exonuclease SbcCD nuclease subunit
MTNRRLIPSKSSNFEIAETSDTHLGHPDTDTEHVLASLSAAFPQNETTARLDWIIHAGDLFDRQMSVPDPNVYRIRAWWTSFLRFCKLHDIVLFIIEGTPSHDWRQSKMLLELNELSQIGADVRYIDTLSIQFIERWGISVLCVPDEWRVRCDDTWQEVVALLKEHNLEKVDYAIMHGCFPHQLPKNIHHQLEMHDPSRYLSIVSEYIFIGHIHFTSQWDRILSSGSIDRLTHGEEGPKGHLRVTRRQSGDDEIRFIENKHAQIYKTILCTGVSTDDLGAVVDAGIRGLINGSHVRIKAVKGDPAMASLDFFKMKYPQYTWKLTEVNTDENKQQPVLVDMRKEQKTINITKANIASLLLERIRERHPGLVEQCRVKLEEIIRG